MSKNIGASSNDDRATAASQSNPQAVSSQASIPSAGRAVNYQAWADNAVTFIGERGLEQEFQDWCGGWPCPIENIKSDALTISADGALRRVASQIRHRLSDMELRQNVSWPASSPAAKTSGYVISEVADWQLRQWLAIVENVAQAIEARSGETGQQARSGTDESAVPTGCAPTSSLTKAPSHDG